MSEIIEETRQKVVLSCPYRPWTVGLTQLAGLDFTFLRAREDFRSAKQICRTVLRIVSPG